jgi:uncharacterized iron-regulated protein
VVDGRTGRAVDEATFWTAVGAARAVCLGEEHPNPHHHWAQLAIVRRLIDGGGRRALGLEMVQGSLQGIVDDSRDRRDRRADLRQPGRLGDPVGLPVAPCTSRSWPRPGAPAGTCAP